jgi:hypothetical protein
LYLYEGGEYCCSYDDPAILTFAVPFHQGKLFASAALYVLVGVPDPNDPTSLLLLFLVLPAPFAVRSVASLL